MALRLTQFARCAKCHVYKSGCLRTGRAWYCPSCQVESLDRIIAEILEDSMPTPAAELVEWSPDGHRLIGGDHDLQHCPRCGPAGAA